MTSLPSASTAAAVAVHKVAARGFNLQTAAYEAARPSYPAAVIKHLTTIAIPKLAAKPSSCTVLDLAAGTGKMTRLLQPYNFSRLVAVEPAQGMREQFAKVVPGVEILDGTSTAIPLPDATCDAVIVAQAFHWFATMETLEEIARVLKPGGACALVWNLEANVGISGRLRALYEPYEGGTPQYRLGLWKEVFEKRAEDVARLFGPVQTHVVEHNVEWTEDETWMRVLSKSYVSCLEARDQEVLESKIRETLREPGLPWREKDGGRRVMDFPYQTDTVWFAKK
ncbi:hypothetical protein HDU86_005598 [Geranomyces michiganensis]|nr:hypothetical protein HDU86_005598 [Geranomyces michiganensis]